MHWHSPAAGCVPGPLSLASFIQEDKPVTCKALLWILFLKLSFGVGNSTPRA